MVKIIKEFKNSNFGIKYIDVKISCWFSNWISFSSTYIYYYLILLLNLSCICIQRVLLKTLVYIRPCLISGTLSFEFVRLGAWRWSISEVFSLKTFFCSSSDLVKIKYFTKNYEKPKFFENLFWFQNIDYEPSKNRQFFPKINTRT